MGAQKIDSLSFMTFEIIIVSFSIDNKFRRPRFFKEKFVLYQKNLYKANSGGRSAIHLIYL